MDEYRDTLVAIRDDLRRANDILAGIADDQGGYRSPEEIRGGVSAASETIRRAWRRAIRASSPRA